MKEEVKLPLPVGVSDYCTASEFYYYVDKNAAINIKREGLRILREEVV